MNDVLFRVALLANLGSTLWMTGLIWFVQIVHYPLFAMAKSDGFAEYEKKHSQLTSLVVGPPMLIEAVSALWLVLRLPADASSSVRWVVWPGLALVALIWLTTATIQIPCHTCLAGGYDSAIHRRLVRSNWVRTIAWTLRSDIVLFLVWRSIRP